MSLLNVVGLVKHFGGLTATDGVNLTVEPGEIHAVIGPNGAGKTTLINQLSGELRPDAGTIVLDGMDVTALPVFRRALLGLGRSYQITSVFPDFTVLVNVVLAAQAHQGHSFSFWRPVLTETTLTERARRAIEQVGLTARTDVPVAALAHGERRQLEMAMTLATAPKVLLLDEPMAGMSLAESERLVTLLASLKAQHGILLVEHDMDAVFKLADRISVLVYGRVIACGDPDAIRNNPDVRTAYLGDDELAI
ncbi:MAG: ABC transporter ATP-binding protein [Betaproteobacteria bacterium]